MSFNQPHFIHADEPVLKLGWERLTTHYDLKRMEAERILNNYIPEPIDQIILLSEGCANSNFKITFKSKHPPLVLRLYLRDKAGLTNELNIYRYINHRIPVAQIYYHDDQCDIIPHPFALFEWVDGILMRDVILRGDQNAIQDCAYDAGRIVSLLKKMTFEQCGFFQTDFSIRPFSTEEQYLPYINMLLVSAGVTISLGKELMSKVNNFISMNKNYIPDILNANLTHADFDPANMIVAHQNGRWKVTAVLDWEFALASTYLLDMGLFLRYSQRLPAFYRKGFIQGVESAGEPLPDGWEISARLMNLLCLLQLLYYNPPEQRPSLNADVVSLIRTMVNG